MTTKLKRSEDFVHELGLKFAPATGEELESIRKSMDADSLPDGFVAGWASTSSVDLVRDKIMPGAFAKSIEDRGLTGAKGIRLLKDHNPGEVIGVITALEQKGERLWIEANINPNISYAKDLYEVLKMTGGLNFSVGYRYKRSDERPVIDDETGLVDHYQITKADLVEVSVVTFPANEEATMEFVKSGEAPAETLAEFERNLMRAGIAKSRNDARKITLEVKKCPHLFVSSESEGTEDNDSAPWLASDIKKLSVQLAELKAAIAPVAKDRNANTE